MEDNDLNNNNDRFNEPKEIQPPELSPELSYEERLKITGYIIGWLFLLSIPLTFATLFAISIVATLTGTPLDTPEAGQVIMLAGAAINIVIGYPIVLNFLLKKKFAGFRLKIERDKD